MTSNTQPPLKVFLFCIFLTLGLSCSKDSDLLSDYVLADADSSLENRRFVVDDTYYYLAHNESIILDVLSNDQYDDQEEVTITETSSPSNGIVEINPDETLTYTPNSDAGIEDTFTYTTEVVNPDQSITAEEGTVTVVPNNVNRSGTIVLDELHAFPSAFGAGKDLTGGRGGTYYEVTNLNNSGPGSFREALNQGNGTIIIIKVEGIVNLTSDISGSAPDNITIWGQFAPGNGLTLSNRRITFEGASNWITRHMTFQNKNNSGCPDPKAGGPNCRSGVAWRDMTQSGGLGVYIDHVSTRWGLDQTIDVGHGQSTNRSTMAYNFLGQGHEDHNTGGFAGGIGDFTYARNAIVSISHRFAIHSGGNIENYNNYIVNYGSRIANGRASTQIDYFKNYVEKGNAGRPSQSAVNKMEGDGISGFRTYTADNYVEHIDENPSGLQRNLWQNRNGPEGPNFTAIDEYHYVSSRLNNFGEPADGEWDWSQVKANALANAGHNRGINADGSPGYFRDDVDTDFATRANNGTTRSTRLTAAQMYNSTFTGTSLYADTDGDHMPDWFENQHPHLNPNEDDKNLKHVEWNFGNYNVVNNAGYTNLEICAEFYAGGFETMLLE
ncbi:Ig-like domain-containing protein [Ulvibacterium marinum]|uniref:Ig-like domain-containing protein n=1 Tax=Ulvibacterium marinum TaxID=2419782 RepID=UPI002493E594|nr:Ig-like domain-containing protein [Ulvibacterium marinum]